MLLKENWRAWQRRLFVWVSSGIGTGAETRADEIIAGEMWSVLEVQTYVKSPVASLCLLCSSVKKRVRVTISVLIVCPPAGPIPLG